MMEWVQAFFKCRCLCYNYYKKVSREVLLRERRKQQDMNLTIAKDTRTEQIISKSRFICSLKKVKTEDEAQEFIKAVKKEFWDATHNTAGMPMLGVLRKQNLQQVAAVVTRYFGGIKLGAGGLVRAYAGSVSRAVEEAGLAQKVRMGLYVFSCEPGEAGKITNLLYQQQMFTLTDADYGTRVNFTLRMPDALKGQAEAWLTDALQRQTELTEAGWEFEEVPVKE